MRWLSLVVRTKADPIPLIGIVKNQIHSVDRNQPVYQVSTMEQVLSDSISRRRFHMTMLGAFAGAALLLAAIGIYGVISYAVSRRTHEIGIRMALGARSRTILTHVIGQGMLVTLTGVAIGLLASLLLSRFLIVFLFGVTPNDLLTLMFVSLFLTAISLLACYLPARRATKVDPLTALRCV